MTLDDYREYLYGIGRKPKTVRNYTTKLAQYLEWCATNQIDPVEIKPSQVRELAQIWPRTASSQGQLKAMLRHYWIMLGVTGPVDAVTVPTKPPARWRGLEDDIVRRLLDVARSDWPRGGVIYLGIYLGLRREEIATLRWRTFEPDLSWVRIVGKKDRTRDLPVHPRVQAILRPNRWPGEFVFPGRMGGHITTTTVSNWVEDIAQQAGIGHITPHQMRHTSGGKVNDETEDIYAAQAWLGHVDVRTTQGYTRVKAQRLVRAMNAHNWEDEAMDQAA